MHVLARTRPCLLTIVKPSLLPRTAYSLRGLATSGVDASYRTCAPVPNRALLAVTGSQASTFLNGITTVQIPSPDSEKWKVNGRGLYSAFLSAQGRIMYDVFIYPYVPKDASEKPGYIVEYDPRAAEIPQSSASGSSTKHATPLLLSMLKRYILRSKVRVRDVTAEWDLWAVWGAGAPIGLQRTPDDWRWGRSGAVEPIFNDANRKPPTPEAEAAASLWITGASDLSSRAVWMQDRRSPDMGARVLMPKGITPVTDDVVGSVVSPDQYTLHRIKLGVPEGVEDMSPQESFPMDANMDMMGGVDFRKGCYVGQELTVRTYHTGVIRKRIFPVKLSNSERSQIEPSVLPSQTPVQAAWQPSALAESPRPRPRGTGKLLSTTPEGYALALLRLEVFQATEKQEMKLSVESADESKTTWEVIPRRPSWWPSELSEEERHEQAPE